MVLKNFLFVGLGGMIGSMARYAVYLVLGHQNFPLPTLIVNIAGSFAIGTITGFALKHADFTDWRLFLATGVCGGFTTFSALSLESLQLLQSGKSLLAFTYIISSFLFGITAAYLGFALGK